MSGPSITPPWGFAIVRGASMSPTLRPGDRVLLSYRREAQVGDVVLARFADGTVVVKRVGERLSSGWWLVSDAPAIGVDSRHRGPVPDADLLAVARVRIWPRPRRL
ncbi:MAG: S26 family signal peptidase [Nocardioides sp.]